MKKLLLLIAFVCCLSVKAGYSQSVELFFNVEVINNGGADNPLPKGPVNPPQATLDGNVLTFESSHPAYALTLFDEDGFVVYQTAVSATTYTVVLPSTLSGNYVLTLDFGGSYYFWSEIEL